MFIKERLLTFDKKVKSDFNDMFRKMDKTLIAKSKILKEELLECYGVQKYFDQKEQEFLFDDFRKHRDYESDYEYAIDSLWDIGFISDIPYYLDIAFENTLYGMGFEVPQIRERKRYVYYGGHFWKDAQEVFPNDYIEMFKIRRRIKTSFLINYN